MSIWKKDLSQTALGRLVVSVIVPGYLVFWGIDVLVKGQIYLRGSYFDGEGIVFYGLALTLFGLSGLFLPSLDDIMSGGVHRFHYLRMIVCSLLAAIFIGIVFFVGV